MTVIAYSQAWVPAMFQRTWGMEASTYAYINGLLLLAFGPISNNVAGWLCDYWEKKGHKDAGLRVLILGLSYTSANWNSGPINANSYTVLDSIYS